MNTVENITNNLTAAAGADYLRLSPNSAQNMTLGLSGAAETQGGLLIIQPLGTSSFGTAAITSATVNESNVTIGNTSGLMIGSGSVGQNTVGIAPWMIGAASSTDPGSSFITYDPSNGLRSLSGSESTALTNSMTNSSSAPNVTVAAPITLTANTYVNSVNFTRGPPFQ